MARVAYAGADVFVPADRDLEALRAAAAGCEGCDLYERATQTVFSRGEVSARMMLVGEQPGDKEDEAGKPFVGPAGRVLVDALRAADVATDALYVTNAVKHFRFKQVRGSKRRLHEKPSAAQATACRPWLAAELEAVTPDVVVALGATAAGSLFGSAFRLTASRGQPLDWPPDAGPFRDDATRVGTAVATIHPSAVLRAEADQRNAMFDGLVADLRVAASLLG